MCSDARFHESHVHYGVTDDGAYGCCNFITLYEATKAAELDIIKVGVGGSAVASDI